jgi:hypothetical protein
MVGLPGEDGSLVDEFRVELLAAERTLGSV